MTPHRRGFWLSILATGWLVIACQTDVFHFPHVQNNTSEPVRVFLEHDGQEFEQIHVIAPGASGDLGNYSQGCTNSPLVVRGTNGDEIARRSEPLCPDETWTVGPGPSPAAS
jgi:hypothetical protein